MALSAGTTDLIANVPSGFSVPNQNRIVTAIVTPSGLNLSLDSGTIGKDLQTAGRVVLSGPAPGNTEVTLTSEDAAKLLFSNTATGAGSPSITVTVGAGFIISPDFYIQGMAGSGAGTYRASAPGFGEKVGTVSLAPSGFVIAGPFGIGSPSFPTTTGAANTTIYVYSALLDSSFNYLGSQPVRGGLSVNIAVTSSAPLVGTITTSPVTITAGSDYATTEFDPLSAGDAILTAGVPPGFSTPAQFRQVTAQVNTPGLSVTTEEIIGLDLQVPGQVILGQAAPAGGLDVTLTSANASLLTLATSAGVEGSGSITIHIPVGGNSGSYFLQGRASGGTVTYTASATGYNSRTGSITLARSGLAIPGLFGFGGPQLYYVSMAAGPAPLTVYAARLTSTNTYADVQSLRGGMSVNVAVQSNSNPGAGTVTPSVTLSGGSNSAALTFTPVTVGASTTITLGTPVNFGLSADKKFLSITVNP
jgi:hypothetical protein